MTLRHAAALIALLAAPAGARAPAIVVQIEGAPAVERSGTREPLQPGASLQLNDVIITGADAKVRVVLGDDSVLTVGPSSRVVLDEMLIGSGAQHGRLRVLAGTFKIAIATLLSAKTDYEIRTPTAVVGVRGTVVWGDIELDAICALDGKVEVRTLAGTDTAALTAGECVRNMGRGALESHKPTAAELERYLQSVTLE